MSTESLVLLGKRIRAIRKELRLTQEDLAAVLGISSRYLSEIERGNANPTAEMFFNLIEKYNVNISFLFHGNGEKKFVGGPVIDPPEFDLDSIVDTKGNLIWLLENSTFIRNTFMGYASKLVFENKGLINSEIERAKNKV